MAILPKGQREQIMLLVVLAALGGAFAYWYLLYTPQRAAFELREQRVNSLVALNQRAKAELAKGNVSDLRRQLAEHQQNLELVRTLVPTGNEVPLLLEQVSTAARRVGLDLAAVDPQPVTQGDQYDTYRYNVAVIGGYHELAEFLTNVGTLTRIVLPTHLQLQLPPGQGQNQSAKNSRRRKGSAVLEARLQLQTYVARKTTSADAPPTAKTGAD